MPDETIWRTAAQIVAHAGDRDSIDFHLLTCAAPAVFAGDLDALHYWRLVSDTIETILTLASAC